MNNLNNPDCIFCKIANKTIPAKFVYEDDEIIAFEDIKPQAPVHILVVPKAHIKKISDISNTNEKLVGKLISVVNKIAKDKSLIAKGYRLVINCGREAGQEVFHMHLHLLGGRKFNWPPG